MVTPVLPPDVGPIDTGGGTVVTPTGEPLFGPIGGPLANIDWGGIFDSLQHDVNWFLTGVGQSLGLWGGGGPEVVNADLIIPNIITAIHFNNQSIARLHYAVEALITYDQNLERFAESTSNTMVSLIASIQRQINDIKNGVTPIIGEIPQATLDQLRVEIQAFVVPLTDNLGLITQQTQALERRLTALEAQHATENLNVRVTSVETWIDKTLFPLLVPLVAIAGANILVRLAVDEQCCVTNDDFRNEFQSLLKAIKPLLEALKALQALDLVALAAAIFAEGLPGAAREIGRLAEAHFASAEGDIASFLGL